MLMDWIALVVAGFFEAVWAVGLKSTCGFTRFWPSVYTVAAMVVSVFLLSWSVRTLPIGTAYAVWTGIGAVLTVVAGMVLYEESRDVLRMLFVVMIVAGIIGLKVVTK